MEKDKEKIAELEKQLEEQKQIKEFFEEGNIYVGGLNNMQAEDRYKYLNQ
jgi:hypothetical protein